MNNRASQTPIRREHFAGGLILVIGLGVAAEGWGYEIGTLTEMGPGFFPVMLGAVLIIVGGLIALVGETPGEDTAEASRIDLRGIAYITGAILAFILLAQHGGLIPATFTAVLLAALGDRTATLPGSLVLAAVITVVGAGVFHYALGLQLPLFGWGQP